MTPGHSADPSTDPPEVSITFANGETTYSPGVPIQGQYILNSNVVNTGMNTQSLHHNICGSKCNTVNIGGCAPIKVENGCLLN